MLSNWVVELKWVMAFLDKGFAEMLRGSVSTEHFEKSVVRFYAVFDRFVRQ